MKKKVKFENNKSIFDPSGSYTGVSCDEDEKPVQDVDDL